MTYNEADHPRDEKGRWVDKNGNTENDSTNQEILKGGVEVNVYNESPAQILYKGSIIKKEKEKIEGEYKNILFQTLGKFVTNTMMLYYNIDQLEKKIKELHLEEKLKQNVSKATGKVKSFVDARLAWGGRQVKNFIKKRIDERDIEKNAKDIGKKYNVLKNQAAKVVFGEDAAGMLDISHDKVKDRSYLEGVFEIPNYKDERFKKYQPYLENKISKQFAHYGTNPNDVKGYYFGPNAKASVNMAQDSYMQQYVKDNKNGFLNNDLKKTSIDFKAGNMYYAHHLVDVIDYQFDSEGNLEILIADTNDFNENEDNKLVQAGDIAMKNKELKPQFAIKHVIIPKEKLGELWGKY